MCISKLKIIFFDKSHRNMWPFEPFMNTNTMSVEAKVSSASSASFPCRLKPAHLRSLWLLTAVVEWLCATQQLTAFMH